MDADLIGRTVILGLLGALGYALWRESRSRRVTLALHDEIRRDNALRRERTERRLAALEAEDRAVLLAAWALREGRAAEVRLTLSPDRRLVIEERPIQTAPAPGPLTAPCGGTSRPPR